VDLAEHLHEPLLDEGGKIRWPLVCVDLDAEADAAVVATAARAAARSDRILVGVATRWPVPVHTLPLLDALDLSLVPAAAPGISREQIAVPDPLDQAAVLQALAGEYPHAATVLAGLLRWSGTLPVPAGLDAESLAYSTLLGGPEFRRWLERRGPRPLPPPAPAEPVLVDRDGALLHITLNRPERRNAYGREVRDALVAALEIALLDSGVERVLLDGAGPVFGSGGDLDEFGTTPDLVTAHVVRTRGGAARLLHQLADQVEVRVHGTCVGAGIELPAFAGRVVAAPGTTFRLPEVAMGLIPGAGGTVSIPRRIGRWRTLYLSLTGAALDADTASEWGLIDHVEDWRDL
jgi:enoyl-CoA hydratase/carnithine racemase